TRWGALLPGGAAPARLGWLLHRHASSPLQARLPLQPDPAAPAPPLRLGRSRLGWSSWLGAGTAQRPPAALTVSLGGHAAPAPHAPQPAA
ncbi:type VI secretion system baseplate subunit TssG, partial [Ideonella livida]